MTKKSNLEAEFFNQIAMFGLPTPQVEYRFHPTRKWRFDGAYPELKIAYEIEGGIYTNGAHNRAAHYISDCQKYNEAARLGWKVYRFPTPTINRKDYEAVGYLKMVLEEAQNASS